MRFSLGTLLAVVSLSALVFGAFTFHVIAGIVTYVACVSLFMTLWRAAAVGRELDLDPEARIDPATPRRVFVSCVGIALVAAIAFFVAFIAVQGRQIMLDVHFDPFFGNTYATLGRAPGFNSGLWLSLPVGTVAGAFVFWLSWPRKSSKII